MNESIKKSEKKFPTSSERGGRHLHLWPSLEPERVFLLAGLLLSIFLGAAAVHSYNSTRLVRKTIILAQHYEQEETLVSRYLLAMEDAETGQRGYLLTGDDAFLAPYIFGVKRSLVLENVMQQSFAGSLAGKENLNALFRVSARKRAELAQTIGLYKKGQRSEALDILKKGSGKIMMDQIRLRVQTLEDREKNNLLTARDALSRRLRYAERDLLAAGIALGGLFWLLWRLLSLSMEKKRRSREILEQETQVDRLTGFPNRKRLFEYLPEACRRSQEEGQTLAVLFIDLDGFKLVNDRHGHAAGDRVLMEVAHRFSALVRSEDLLARLGGDEFVICLPGQESEEGVVALAHRLIASFDEPFFSPIGKGVLSCSVGVALFPRDANSPAELVAAADMAMYQSKNAGKRRVSFYNPRDRGAMSSLPHSS